MAAMILFGIGFTTLLLDRNMIKKIIGFSMMDSGMYLYLAAKGYVSLFFTLGLMIVLLYFMIYRPQKKQEKKDAEMRKNLEIGDQVTTIGGVIGRVVAIKDDSFVLETGSDRVKIRFTKTAIGAVEKLNMDDAPAKK